MKELILYKLFNGTESSAAFWNIFYFLSESKRQYYRFSMKELFGGNGIAWSTQINIYGQVAKIITRIGWALKSNRVG